MFAVALATAAPTLAFNGSLTRAGGESARADVTLIQTVQSNCACRPGRWIVVGRPGLSGALGRRICRRAYADSRAVGGALARYDAATGNCYICYRGDVVCPGTPGGVAGGGGGQCVAAAQTASPQPTYNFVTKGPSSSFHSALSAHHCVTQDALAAWLKQRPGTVILPDRTRSCPNPKCPAGFSGKRDSGGGLICVQCQRGSYSVRFNCCI